MEQMFVVRASHMPSLGSCIMALLW